MPAERRSSPKPAPPPLDRATLERLGLRYVERFATTRGKLVDYLRRKIRERGWTGPAAEPVELAERLAGLGYIDDRAFAAARATALARRGLGERRVSGALREARIVEEDRIALAPDIAERAVDAALAFARRKRLGPWASENELDRLARVKLRDKQLGAMLRAGHPMDLSRRILALPPDTVPNPDDLA